MCPFVVLHIALFLDALALLCCGLQYSYRTSTVSTVVAAVVACTSSGWLSWPCRGLVVADDDEAMNAQNVIVMISYNCAMMMTDDSRAERTGILLNVLGTGYFNWWWWWLQRPSKDDEAVAISGNF